jgi:hypothetical protein
VERRRKSGVQEKEIAVRKWIPQARSASGDCNWMNLKSSSSRAVASEASAFFSSRADPRDLVPRCRWQNARSLTPTRQLKSTLARPRGFGMTNWIFLGKHRRAVARTEVNSLDLRRAVPSPAPEPYDLCSPCVDISFSPRDTRFTAFMIFLIDNSPSALARTISPVLCVR